MLSRCCLNAMSLNMHQHLIHLQQVYNCSLAILALVAESSSLPGSLHYIGGMHLLMLSNAHSIFSRYR